MSNLRCIVIIFKTYIQNTFQYTAAHGELTVNAEKWLETTYFFISMNTSWFIYQAIQNVYLIVSRSIQKQHSFIDFKHRREYCKIQYCTNDSLYHKRLQVL